MLRTLAASCAVKPIKSPPDPDCRSSTKSWPRSHRINRHPRSTAGPAKSGPPTDHAGIGPLERAAIALASLALSAVAIAAIAGFFSAHDQPAVSGPRTGPGQVFRDLGDEPLRAGQRRAAYGSDPPTSGPHRQAAVLDDDVALTDDQLLSALALGDVVVMYRGPHPPPGLARSVAGQFNPVLAAAGEAVILASRPGSRGLIALAWARMLRVPNPNDARLRAFAQSWLGEGAHAHP